MNHIIMEKEQMLLKTINLYSDGAAIPNPGIGGFGVILEYNSKRKEFFQGYARTTNNRMELMGVIFGLQKLTEKCSVSVYTDSRYVVDGISLGWAKRWKENNWQKDKKTKALNRDLWGILLDLLEQHKVTFYWIKGHAGHLENERCDELANFAIESTHLLEDKGYRPEESNIIPKIVNEGDLCRKCETPVVKKDSKNKKHKPNKTYCFEYYLYCPKCTTMYMVEDAKRVVPPLDDRSSLFSK